MEKGSMTKKHFIRTPYDLSLNELRHSHVFELIAKFKVTSLLDLGCSKGQFLRMAARSPHLKLLSGLDIDQQILKKALMNTIPQPLQANLQYDRVEDLRVEVFHGNFLHCYPQLKNKSFQMVSLIEVIEHLSLSDVSRAIKCIWGYLQPQIVALTTPNKQFNIHFCSNPQKLRHWDHKFQWTQLQFRQFCQKIAHEYSYDYQITGIGEHVADNSRGCCTQMAVFVAKKSKKPVLQQTLIEEANQSLVKLQEHTIQCWRSRISQIMKDLLYMGLQNKVKQSFIDLLSLIKQHPLGLRLQDQHIKLDYKFIKNFIFQFEDCFECDQQYYWHRINESPQQSMSQSNQEGSDCLQFGFKQEQSLNQ